MTILTLTFNCLFAIQSVLSINSPIKKLLVSINQWNSGNLIYFYYKFFDRVKEANIYATKLRGLVSSFILKENHIFNEEDNPSQKVVIGEEELDDMYLHIKLDM